MLQIMIVDDEEFALNHLESLIHKISDTYQVVAKALSGMEALVFMDIVQPDLIITDVKMPEMDGLTMLKQINESGWKGKAIVVSGYDDFPLLQEALRIGVQDYLLKPVVRRDLEELFSGIEKCLSDEKKEQQRLRNEVQTQILKEYLSLRNPDTSPIPDYVVKAQSIIKDHYHQRLTLSELANKVNVNSAYLSYSFRKYTGQNVVEYLTKIRIEASKCLLRSTNMQIQEIAESVGYFDVKYFSRVFRNLTGCPPSKYREKCRELN